MAEGILRSFSHNITARDDVHVFVVNGILSANGKITRNPKRWLAGERLDPVCVGYRVRAYMKHPDSLVVRMDAEYLLFGSCLPAETFVVLYFQAMTATKMEVEIGVEVSPS